MKKIRNRLRIVFLLILGLFIALFWRLYTIQVVEADFYAQKARSQHAQKFSMPAIRGKIFDARGDILAVSNSVYTIWAHSNDKIKAGDPAAINTMRRELGLISDIIEIDIDKVIDGLRGENVIVHKIASEVPRKEADLICELARTSKVQSISLDELSKRFYPFGESAAHVIGLADGVGTGITGLEHSYNKELSGEDGYIIRTTDVRKKALPYGIIDQKAADNGMDIHSSISQRIQYFVEHQIKSSHSETGAISVSAIVTRTRDGSIVAMSSYPGFDLNRPRDLQNLIQQDEWEAMSDQEKTDFYYSRIWKNRVISDTFEPGSTFKTVIAAIALEEGLVVPSDTFFCKGYRDTEDYQLKCHIHPAGHGHQNLQEAFVNSCNVAFMEIADKIGKDTLYRYFRELGLLEPSGIDLPGESAPISIPLKDVREVELLTLGYGHGISLNMLNINSAISATVTGVLHKPHICSYVQDGDEIHTIPDSSRRIFSDKTTMVIRQMMEARSRVPLSKLKNKSFALGGKSGTSVKLKGDEYDMKKVISSFIVFGPIDDPEYSVYVMIDEPDLEIYDYSMAESLASKIIADIFRFEAIGRLGSTGEDIEVPDLMGLNADDAARVAGVHGFKVSYTPVGILDNDNIEEQDAEQKNDPKDYFVKNQYPKAGGNAPRGSTLILNIGEKNE